jgi:hypothetical protein
MQKKRKTEKWTPKNARKTKNRPKSSQNVKNTPRVSSANSRYSNFEMLPNPHPPTVTVDLMTQYCQLPVAI